MMRNIIYLVALLATFCSPTAFAQSAANVDVELVLAVDESTTAQYMAEFQRAAYADAFQNRSVINAILGGYFHRIAVTYIAWSDPNEHRIVIPWTLIDSAATSIAFSEQLRADKKPPLNNYTSLSGGLQYAASLFGQNGQQGLRRVIDISSDGPNNRGAPIKLVRDLIVARGITINGLPIPSYTWKSYKVDMSDYYDKCVVGGPLAFIRPVPDNSEFAEAVRQKLQVEISGQPPPLRYAARATPGIILVNAGSVESYSCDL